MSHLADDQRMDWKEAFGRAMTGTNAEYQAWLESPERNLMCAEGNGKTAASYAESGIPGMAGGYARIAAHYAFKAIAILQEGEVKA